MVHTLPLVEDELLYPRAYIDSAGSHPRKAAVIYEYPGREVTSSSVKICM